MNFGRWADRGEPKRVLLLVFACWLGFARSLPAQDPGATAVRAIVSVSGGIEFDTPPGWAAATGAELRDLNFAVGSHSHGAKVPHYEAALVPLRSPYEALSAYVLVGWAPDKHISVKELADLSAADVQRDLTEGMARSGTTGAEPFEVDAMRPFSVDTMDFEFRAHQRNAPDDDSSHVRTVGRLTRNRLLLLDAYSDEGHQLLRDACLDRIVAGLRIDPSIGYEVTLADQLTLHRSAVVLIMAAILALMVGACLAVDRLSRRRPSR